MTYSDLVVKISKDTSVPQSHVDNVFRSLVDVIREEVRGQGLEVAIPGLGRFKQKKILPRKVLGTDRMSSGRISVKFKSFI